MTIEGMCPEGQEFVRPFTKRNGVYVKGFCREKRNFETKHDIAADKQNLIKAREELVEESANGEVEA